MFKYTCIVLCAVAVSLSSVSGSDESDSSSFEDWDMLRDECLEAFEVSADDIGEAVETGDVSKVKPCYWGCYFKKLGLLNDKGQYDLDNYLITVRKLSKTDKIYADVENLGKKCLYVKDKAVNDGEAGCEMGALVAACFIRIMSIE